MLIRELLESFVTFCAFFTGLIQNCTKNLLKLMGSPNQLLVTSNVAFDTLRDEIYPTLYVVYADMRIVGCTGGMPPEPRSGK